MPYIAHVGIELGVRFTAYSEDQWELIQVHNNLRYHRRIKNRIYEIVCELFDDKESALISAKSIYTQVLYNLLKNGISIVDAGCSDYERRLYNQEFDGDMIPDWSFYWTPDYQGGGIGPGVYKVDNSFDEFDESYCHLFFEGKLSVLQDKRSLDFRNYEYTPFLFSKTSQRILKTVLIADSVSDLGLSLTLYCGILEHLASEKYKDDDVIAVIDELLQKVNSCDLDKDKKRNLVSFLEYGKKESARKKCLRICDKYARKQYGEYKTKDIINDAYGIRSRYSHGEDCRYDGPRPALYIKYVVLDAIEGYMVDPETNKTETETDCSEKE